ncbi:MAG TPA: ATP-binding protein [Mycobacteriales bacterium]|nr:ATP-binding protein [Mycobacteriales bacterium]
MISHRLPHEPASAGIARARVRAELGGWGTSERVEDAMLLVTELIANAVIHGKPEICLDVDVDGSTSLLLVRVTDGSPLLPRLSDGRSPGRGLGIVDSLADRWGVEPLPDEQDGKRVWFELLG